MTQQGLLHFIWLRCRLVAIAEKLDLQHSLENNQLDAEEQ